MTLRLLLALCIAAGLGVPLCARADSVASAIANPAPAHPELKAVFEEFGGKPGLKALMDDLMVILLADPRMNPFFVAADQQRIKDKLAEQFCVILGGDCVYTGMDMVEAHKGIEVHHADFNALVEDLQVAMDARGISNRAQNKLLAKLAPMHREVINR